MVNIEDMIFTRGEDGILISQEVELELLPDKPKVKIIPLTRGKLQEIYAQATTGSTEEKAKADTEIIKCGLVEPKLTDKQLIDLKPLWATAITTAVLSISLGIEQTDVKKQAQSEIERQESELKK